MSDYDTAVEALAGDDFNEFDVEFIINSDQWTVAFDQLIERRQQTLKDQTLVKLLSVWRACGSEGTRCHTRVCVECGFVLSLGIEDQAILTATREAQIDAKDKLKTMVELPAGRLLSAIRGKVDESVPMEPEPEPDDTPQEEQ